MLDLIMKILGYENIKKIRIKKYYKPPKTKKMIAKENFYNRYNLLTEIILDRNNFLVDGYCSYQIAKANRLKYVKVRKSKYK